MLVRVRLSVGEVRNLNVLARALCYKVGSLPMTYLGMLLEAHYKDSSIWNHITKKMERWLSSWKRLYLSKDGKFTLLNSTLSSLPTYFLSLFTIPQAVAARLERILGKPPRMFLNILWLLGRRFVCLWKMVVWGSGRLVFLTKLCFVSGYGYLGRKV